MAKISLSKTIEATKLNKRTGLAESGPETNIPFGALVEYVQTERGSVRFLFMGEPYRCPEDLWNSAVSESSSAPKTGASAVLVTQAAAATPGLVWQALPSDRYQVARAKVPGGWLITMGGQSLTFYPDPEHQWDGTSPA